MDSAVNKRQKSLSLWSWHSSGKDINVKKKNKVGQGTREWWWRKECVLFYLGKSGKGSDAVEKLVMWPPRRKNVSDWGGSSVKAKGSECLLCLSQAQCARRWVKKSRRKNHKGIRLDPVRPCRPWEGLSVLLNMWMGNHFKVLETDGMVLKKFDHGCYAKNQVKVGKCGNKKIT